MTRDYPQLFNTIRRYTEQIHKLFWFVCPNTKASKNTLLKRWIDLGRKSGQVAFKQGAEIQSTKTAVSSHGNAPLPTSIGRLYLGAYTCCKGLIEKGKKGLPTGEGAPNNNNYNNPYIYTYTYTIY